MDPGHVALRLQFGDVTLIPDERLVFKSGQPVRLTPKAFDLLVALATSPGRLLTKEQLMQAVWGDTTVEESNLSYHVFAIRKALGDTPENGHLIETVPKLGYRFTALVERIDGWTGAEPAAASDSGEHQRSDRQATRPGTTPHQSSMESGVASSQVPRRHRVARRWALVGTACLLSGVWFFAGSLRRPVPVAQPPRAVPLTTVSGVVRSPSLSPDGSYVVFSWTGNTKDNPDLYVQHVGSGGPLRLTTDPANDYSPAWSPDGRWIAFLRRGPAGGASEVRLIAPLGGAERKVADIQPRIPFFRAITLSWCPDATCLLVTDSPGAREPGAVFSIAVDSGAKRQLTFPSDQASIDTDPVIAPDGGSLVFRRDSTPFSGVFNRVALKGLVPDGEPTPLTTTLAAGKPTWTADSRHIVFAARGALWILDTVNGGPPARLPFIGEDGLAPAISRTVDGGQRLVYVRSFADANVWRVDVSAPGVPAAGPSAVAIASTRADSIPSLSPSGQRLTFLSNRTGESEIWVADPDGAHAVQLTALARLPGFPRWSPNGQLIAFHGDPRDRPAVMVVPAEGGQPTIVTTSVPNAAFPSFSRDAQWIYFSVVQEGQSRIWKMPTAGGEPVQVTTNAGTLAIESYDGRDLYYLEAVERPSALWRLPVAGGAPVKVVDGVVLGNFDVVEGGVYYVERVAGEVGAFFADRPGGDTRLQYFDVASGRSTTIAGNLGTVTFGLTASRDGRTVFFSRIDSAVDELMLVEHFR